MIPSYQEIEAFGRVMEEKVTPFEAEIIRDLAKVFLLTRSKKSQTPENFRPLTGKSLVDKFRSSGPGKIRTPK